MALDESLTLQDLGVSAFRSANVECGRLGEFLSAVRAGFIKKGSYLLIENLDRLSRDTVRKAIATLEDICDEGITVVTLMDNQEYTADRLDRDPVAFLISLIIFLRANEESKTKSERSRSMRAQNLERIAQGKKAMLPGTLPAWLKREGNELVVEQNKADVIKIIFKLAERGLGSTAIARTLNHQKIAPISISKYWRPETIRKTLRNRAMIGIYKHRNLDDSKSSTIGQDYLEIRNYYPRIISQRRWNKVQSIINKTDCNPKPNKHPKERTTLLFAWLAKCPRCGSAMRGRVYKSGSTSGKKFELFLICVRSIAATDCDQILVEYKQVEKAFLELGCGMMRSHAAKHKSAKTLGKYHLISAQVSEITKFIKNGELNRRDLNQKLRRIFDSVIIDYKSLTLKFEWSTGETTKLPLDRSTRIYQSEILGPGHSKRVQLKHTALSEENERTRERLLLLE